MKKLYNLRWINLKEIGDVEAPWGALYNIYISEDGIYYADMGEGDNEVIRLRSASSKDAEKELLQSLQEIAAME